VTLDGAQENQSLGYGVTLVYSADSIQAQPKGYQSNEGVITAPNNAKPEAILVELDEATQYQRGEVTEAQIEERYNEVGPQVDQSNTELDAAKQEYEKQLPVFENPRIKDGFLELDMIADGETESISLAVRRNDGDRVMVQMGDGVSRSFDMANPNESGRRIFGIKSFYETEEGQRLSRKADAAFRRLESIPTEAQAAVSQAQSISQYLKELNLPTGVPIHLYEMGENGQPVWGSDEIYSRSDELQRMDAGNIIPLSERFNLTTDDIRYSVSNEDGQQDLTRAVAKDWVNHAVVLELDAVLNQVSEKVGQPVKRILSILGRSFNPGERLLDIQKKTPSAKGGVIGSMNEAMDAQAKQKLWQALANYANRASTKILQLANKAKKSEEAMQEAQEFMADIQNDPANAALIGQDLYKKMRKTLKRMKDQVKSQGRLEAEHGVWVEVSAQLGKTVNDMSGEFVKAFDRVLGNTGGLKPIDYMQALASLNIDWRARGAAREALDLVKNYKTQESFLKLSPENQQTAAKALESMNADPALRAVLVAFAQGNALQIDMLQLRWENVLGRFGEFGKTIEQIRTATDEQLEQMQAEIIETSKDIDVRSRIRRDLFLHKQKHNRHKRALAKAQENKAILEQAAAIFNNAAEKAGEELGAVYDFDGNPGSFFPVMDPVKGGGIKEQVEFKFSISPKDFETAFRTNMDWLEANAELAGKSARYHQVARATMTLQQTVLRQESETAKFSVYRRAMQSIPDLLEASGTRGAKAAATAIRNMVKDQKMAQQRLVPLAQRWSKAYTEMVNAAGYGGAFRGSPSRFNEEIRSNVIHTLEREIGIGTESGAIRKAIEVTEELLANNVLPNPKKRANRADLHKAIGNWIRAERRIGEAMDRLREQYGLAIEDSGVRVADPGIIDPKTGMPRVAAARRMKGVPQGYVTIPRKTNYDLLQGIVHSFSLVGYEESIFRMANKDKRYWEDPSIPIEERLQRVSQEFSKFQEDENLRASFFDPIMNMEDSPFPGGAPMLEVREAWEESSGDFAAFVSALTEISDGELDDMMLGTLATFRKYARIVHQIAERSENREGGDGSLSRHFMIDSRHDSILPKEFFTYTTFDPVSIMSYSATMAANKNFGRDSKLLDGMFELAKVEIDERLAKTKRNKDGKKVRQLKETKKELINLKTQLNDFLLKSDNGPHTDEKLAMEFVSFIVGNVLNNPKTAITQLITPVTEFTTAYKGINKVSATATLGAVKAFNKMMGGSFLEAFGAHLKSLPEYEREIAVMLGNLNRAGMSFSEHMANPGREDQFETKSGRVVKGMRQFRQALSTPLRIGKGSTERTPFAPGDVFNYVATLANYATAVGQLRAVLKVSEGVEKYMEDYGHFEDTSFDPTSEKVLKRLMKKPYGLGSSIPLLKINETGAIKIMAKQIESRFGMPLADFVRMQRNRRLRGERGLTTSDVATIAQIAEDEVSFNSSVNNRNVKMISGPLRYATPLWGWPIRKTEQMHRMLTDDENKYSMEMAAKALATLALYIVPTSLAYSMLLDLYDEWFRGKSPSLKKMRADNSAGENVLAGVERLARIGTYGMAGDVINSVVNWSEFATGGRAVSLDDRVLVMSSFQNALGAVRNFTQQGGNASYQTVWRPLINSMGASGMLQYTQLMNQALRTVGAEDVVEGVPLLKAEDKFTTRSNVYNIVRAAARVADVPIRAGGGFSSPTEATMHMREMQFAAFANDRDAFKEHYRKAVRAYMEQGEGKTYDEALSSVKQSWNRRHPINSITSRVLTDAEMRSVYSKMTDWQEDAVRNAARMHERYSMFLEGPTRSRSSRAPTYVPTPL